MYRNSLTLFARAGAAGVAIFAITACAATGGADWTYAPLGPTPSAAASGAASPGATPGGSPSGEAIEVSTPQSNPLAYDPATLNAPADSAITVRYLNDSNLPHNVNFFNGPDNSAPSLGATAVVTGPGAPEEVSFTTPGPGDYYFWCDVHQSAMSGTLHVD
jgi:plastocyanin